MWTSKAGIACMLAVSATVARAGPPDKAPSALGSTAGSGVYSGYGNYWYPTGYPWPSIGGSGYVRFGPGGAAGYYYAVPGSSGPAASLPPNNPGGPARTIRPKSGPAGASKSGPKPAPAPRKPR